MKAAIYTRVSTLEQAQEGYSLKAQEEKCRAYALAMGFDIVETFIDDGFSGKSLNRPAMQRLINYVEQKMCNIVIIYKLDRMSRKVKDVLELVELFEKYNVSLYSLNENLDLSSPFGRAALKMSATFSELERETIVERMKMGKEQRVKNGYAMRNSNLPIGYDYDSERDLFVPNENESEQVKKVFELYFQGLTIAQISKYMHEHYTNRYGSYNDRTAVDKILRNPFCAGYFTYNGELYKGKNIEPIIDYETWLNAQAIRQNKKGKAIRPGSPYLLTGLLYCGKCGERYVSKKYHQELVAKKGMREYTRLCYGCCARVKRDAAYTKHKCDNVIIKQSEIEDYIIKTIKQFEFYDYNKNTDYQPLSIAEKQILELKEKKDRILELYTDGHITKEKLESLLDEVEKEIKIKEEYLKEQKANIQPKKKVNFNLLNKQIKNWENLEMYDKRLILSQLIDKIIVYEDKLDIKFKLKYK